jgi:hypothetical protein
MKPNPSLSLVQDTEQQTPPLSRTFTWQEIEKLLDRPIAFQRPLAAVAGGALAGLFLSQALYWSQRTSNAEGWFYKTQEEWTEETALTRSEQETVRKHLKARGLIKERRAGLPARLFFQVQKIELFHALEKQFAEMPQSSLQESRKQDRPKPAIKSAGILQSFKGTETTAETTAETTTTADVVEDAKAVPKTDLNTDIITALLMEFDVSPKTARQLALDHPDHAVAQAGFLPHRKKVVDQAATLITSIREDWPAPASWKATQEKEARAHQQAQEAKANEAKRRHHAEQREAQQRQEQNENDALDRHYKSLSAQDRKEIDDQAARRLGPLQAVGLATSGALAAARRNIMRKELGIPTEDDE